MLTAITLVTTLAFAQAYDDYSYNETVTTSVLSGYNAEKLDSFNVGVPDKTYEMSTCQMLLNRKEQLACAYPWIPEGTYEYYGAEALRVDVTDSERTYIKIPKSHKSVSIIRKVNCTSKAKIHIWKICPVVDRHVRSWDENNFKPESSVNNTSEDLNKHDQTHPKGYVSSSGSDSSQEKPWGNIYKHNGEQVDSLVLTRSPNFLKEINIKGLFDYNEKIPKDFALSTSSNSSRKKPLKDPRKHYGKHPICHMCNFHPYQSEEFNDSHEKRPYSSSSHSSGDKPWEYIHKNHGYPSHGFVQNPGGASSKHNKWVFHIKYGKLPEGYVTSSSKETSQNNKWENINKYYQKHPEGYVSSSGPDSSEEESWEDITKSDNHLQKGNIHFSSSDSSHETSSEDLPKHQGKVLGFAISTGSHSSQKDKNHRVKKENFASQSQKFDQGNANPHKKGSGTNIYFNHQKPDDFQSSLSGKVFNQNSYDFLFSVLLSKLVDVSKSLNSPSQEEPESPDLV